MTQHIDQFLQYASNGDQEGASMSIGQALMDKVSEKLQSMKVDIATKQFGFSNESTDIEEGKTFKAGDPDAKKKAESLRKLRKMPAKKMSCGSEE